MRKTAIALCLAAALLIAFSVCAAAYTPREERTADALHELGLFLGTGTGYELDADLTRVQGVTLLVRMMGLESEAASKIFALPFTDVPQWAEGYVACAYAYSITNGIEETAFGSDLPMTDYMFLTMTLRALGYSDSGENPSFTWNDPYAFAKEIGLISSARADASFTRGDAVTVFWNALNARMADGTVLSDALITKGVFTKAKFMRAEYIYENGYPAVSTTAETTRMPYIPGTGSGLPVIPPAVGTTAPAETNPPVPPSTTAGSPGSNLTPWG